MTRPSPTNRPATINKNSRVMFRNRVQTSASPMRVTQVRPADYGQEIKVQGTWWRESAFMLYSEWLQQAATNQPAAGAGEARDE